MTTGTLAHDDADGRSRTGPRHSSTCGTSRCTSRRKTASSGRSTACRFALERGQTLGIVGESGSGKSVTSLGLLGLHRLGNAQVSGQVWLDGEELIDGLGRAGARSCAARRWR